VGVGPRCPKKGCIFLGLPADSPSMAATTMGFDWEES
jgi:hypothetical protein